MAERAGKDEDHATKGIRAVFDTLREVAPGEEFDEVMTQLPREFGALVGSRSSYPLVPPRPLGAGCRVGQHG